MGKTILIVGAILLALAIIVPVAIYYGSDARERKWVPTYSNATTPTTAIVALPLTKVRARLVEKLGADFEGPNSFASLSRPDIGPQFKDFVVWQNQTGSIDSEFRPTETGFSGDAPISTKHLNLETQDPGLPAYLQLPIPARASTI